MTWLVFGVSCLLVLAGAVSIISGAPIIQLERGWAEVISGAVALSSGGIVFALAAVLVRLEGLRETLAARAAASAAVPETALNPLLAATTTRVVDTPPDPIAAPSAPLPETVPPAEVPAAAGAAEHGLWKRIRRPAEQPEQNRLEDQGFPDRAVPDRVPPGPLPSAETPVIVPSHPTPTNEPAAEAGSAKPSDSGQVGWLERSLLKGRTGRPRPEADAPPVSSLFGDTGPEREGRTEPSLGSAPARLHEPGPRRDAPAIDRAAEPAPTLDLAAERSEGITVIGRYQAGTSSYVMYSDGTIEVETEDGEVHRFGSMDELKAYIANQDTAGT